MLGNAIGYEREGDTLIVRLPYAKKGWFRRKFKTAKWNPERRAWVLHKNLRKKLDAAIIEDKNAPTGSFGVSNGSAPSAVLRSWDAEAENDWIDDNGDHHLANYDRDGLAYYANRADAPEFGAKPAPSKPAAPEIKPNAPKRGPNAVRKYMLLIAKDIGVNVERQLPEAKLKPGRYESFYGAEASYVRGFVEALDKVQKHGSHFPDKSAQAYLDYRADLDALREAYPGWMGS